ncbi:MAG: aminotransferase class V-fold PLP-dependent enzyme [Sphingomicrobium sp.]
MSKRIYLDHAATSPVLPEARAAMAEALERWANPSSPHADGRAARAALEEARRSIADALGWRHEVILTSGASEALALAARGAKVPGRIVGATEHDAATAAMGRAKLLKVGADGLIDLAELDALLAGNPSLIAVQHANNETGVIQPLPEIYQRVRASGSLLLADCAQTAGKLPLPDADFIAISAHKLGGPPGAGALLARDLANLRATGGQEKGYRRGTENLPAAAGFAAALRSRVYSSSLPRLVALRAELERCIDAADGVVIAREAPRLPTIGAYALPGVSSVSQLVHFDLAGISVSAGSACSSGSMKPSRVLQAMDLSADVVASTIRVSFGPQTEEIDVERFVTEWRRMADRARSRAA